MSKTATRGEALPTLADIKRKAKEAAEDDEDDDLSKRYRTLNFTSEDNRGPELHTYYCSVCGAHNLVLEGELEGLPTFENTLVLDMDQNFHKSYMSQSDVVFIKRPEGVEARTMMRCKECDFPLSYRVVNADAMTKFLYLFNDALVSRQTEAAAFVTKNEQL